MKRWQRLLVMFTTIVSILSMGIILKDIANDTSNAFNLAILLIIISILITVLVFSLIIDSKNRDIDRYSVLTSIWRRRYLESKEEK